MTSLTRIRMQPCEARVPIEPRSAVPWIPMPPRSPSQRALRGLSGEPPGIVCPKATAALPKIKLFREWLLAEAADDLRRLKSLHSD